MKYEWLTTNRVLQGTGEFKGQPASSKVVLHQPTSRPVNVLSAKLQSFVQQ
jgi:hypothetical protein